MRDVLFAIVFQIVSIVMFLGTIEIVATFLTISKIKKGHYLNERYVCSWNKKYEAYEIHCFAKYGLWFSSAYVYRYQRKQAIEILAARFPDARIIAITSTLQSWYEEQGITGTLVKRNCLMNALHKANSILYICTNLCNWIHIRRNGEWQIKHLILRTLRTPDKLYVIREGKPAVKERTCHEG